MRVAATLVGCATLMLCQGVVAAQPLAPEIEAAIKEATRGDLATAMQRSVDRSEVVLTGRMFHAIEAVERYRQTVQRHRLTRAERRFENFDVLLAKAKQAIGLSPEERRTHWSVAMWGRYQPGETVALDVPPKIGRSASYLVRKKDFVITRARLDGDPESTPVTTEAASEANAPSDDADREVFTSVRTFRAMQAVRDYRQKHQRQAFTPDERDLRAVEIKVSAASEGDFLDPRERKICYEVVITPERPAPAGTTRPRKAFYAVRRSDLRVVRAGVVD